jgi:hypothetical protein
MAALVQHAAMDGMTLAPPAPSKPSQYATALSKVALGYHPASKQNIFSDLEFFDICEGLHTASRPRPLNCGCVLRPLVNLEAGAGIHTDEAL